MELAQKLGVYAVYNNIWAYFAKFPFFVTASQAYHLMHLG